MSRGRKIAARVSAPIPTREEMADELARRRALEQGQGVRRVVLANGCFDLLHVGHLRYLEDARSRGDCLVVALNTDASVRALKGSKRPLIPLEERAELLLGLRAVDFVVAFEEPSLEETLRCLRPDVHAKGTDYSIDNVPERAVDLELGIEIAICGDPKDHATTEILGRLEQTDRPDGSGEFR